MGRGKKVTHQLHSILFLEFCHFFGRQNKTYVKMDENVQQTRSGWSLFLWNYFDEEENERLDMLCILFVMEDIYIGLNLCVHTNMNPQVLKRIFINQS